MKQVHKYTSDQKIEWFTQGTWVEEPDEVFFEHKQVECKILRSIINEGNTLYGGHLCGYVKVLEGNKWYKQKYKNIVSSVHGGVTFAGLIKEEFWVGFDCMHIDDLVPSFNTKGESAMTDQMRTAKKVRDQTDLMLQLKKLRDHSSFHSIDFGTKKTYKDLPFVVTECKKLVDELQAHLT